MIESNSPNLRKIYFLLDALMNDLPFNNLSFFITLIKNILAYGHNGFRCYFYHVFCYWSYLEASRADNYEFLISLNGTTYN